MQLGALGPLSQLLGSVDLRLEDLIVHGAFWLNAWLFIRDVPEAERLDQVLPIFELLLTTEASLALHVRDLRPLDLSHLVLETLSPVQDGALTSLVCQVAALHLYSVDNLLETPSPLLLLPHLRPLTLNIVSVLNVPPPDQFGVILVHSIHLLHVFPRLLSIVNFLISLLAEP